MDITIRHLEVLRAIVASGSISNAKRSLGLSQPTISQQLAKFEEILDAQLIRRTRGQEVQLTHAGEHWFKVAQSVLGTIHKATADHRSSLGKGSLELHFGTTPTLRGRFLEEAASLSRGIPEFSHMQFVWAQGSDELVEMMATHKINCAIVSKASVENYSGVLHVVDLFRDRLVLVVPAGIEDADLAHALTGAEVGGDETNPLLNYVDIGSVAPWHARSENWYRERLPKAVPYFNCMTHQGAVDVVAAGLATCHAPLSLLPNLPESVRRRIKVFDLDEYARDAVLVMPRHLLTLRPFAEFQRRLCEWVQAEYSESYMDLVAHALPDPLVSAE